VKTIPFIFQKKSSGGLSRGFNVACETWSESSALYGPIGIVVYGMCLGVGVACISEQRKRFSMLESELRHCLLVVWKLAIIRLASLDIEN